MFKYLFGVSALLMAVLIVPACKDDHHHHSDTVAPAVTILKPAENESLSGEILMEILVTDEDSLHEMDVTLTKDSDGSVLYTDSPTVHNKKEYSFQGYFTPSVTEEVPVTLTVVVSDHGDNTTTKTVKFKVKP